MASARIPFGNLQASGLEELSGGSPVAMNVVADSLGTVRRRPGIATWHLSVDTDGICGLHETSDGDVYAVGNGPPSRHIYKVTTGSSLDISNVPSGDVRGLARPVFAETGELLVITGGAEPEKVVKSTSIPSLLGGPPPNGSHVVSMTKRLLINDPDGTDSSLVTWSNGNDSTLAYGGNEDWTTTLGNAVGTLPSMGKDQPALAVHENSNEVFCFALSSVRVYAPDSTSVFVPSSSKQFGCGAPYSIVAADQNFAWLDDRRRFVISDGRAEKIVSDPIQQTLHDMGTVSDCFGYRVVLGTLDALVWTFPTERRTFVYQKDAGWGQWSGDGGNFLVTAKTALRATNSVLVGTSQGHLGTLSFDAVTDLDTPINAYVITGFLDRDTDAWKSCNRVRIAMRRGATTTANEPYLLLSWRDGTGAWETPLEVSLGSAGETNPVVEFWSLGVYRRRQWKMDFREAEDLTLVAVTEEFEVLAG